MIVTLSYLVLGFSSIYAALLLYRQPKPLLDTSKVIANLVAICCLFICVSSLLSIFTNNSDSVLGLMLKNLQFYLAIPLLSSILLTSSFNKTFSKATWGRWSLGLLATFELCRRAEVGNIYSDFIVYASSAIVIFSFIHTSFLGKKQSALSDITFKSAAVISYLTSLLVFSEQAVISDYISLNNYNFSLSIALPIICFLTGKKLNTKEA